MKNGFIAQTINAWYTTMAIPITRRQLAHMMDDCIAHALDDGHSSFTMDSQLYDSGLFRSALDDLVRTWNRAHKCHVVSYEPRYASSTLFWITLSVAQIGTHSPGRGTSLAPTASDEVLGETSRWAIVDW